MNELPLVSILIPCRNEAKLIGMCLDSILANDYPRDRCEVFVIDGLSEDETRQIVGAYVRQHAFIHLLDNPKRITPAGLNIGIARAKGDVLIRMDAHARYEKDYISRSVEHLYTSAADNVGGIIMTVPQGESLIGWAIASSISHRFGVGHSLFRVHTNEPRWVDTVFGGCYRREMFQTIGLFNEGLARGQDLELNLRLKKAGGRLLLAPDIVSYYYARSDMKSFWAHNWSNGVWAILPFLYSDIIPVSWRHLVPLTFVLGVLGAAGLALVMPAGWWVLPGVAGTYALANLAASLHVTVKRRDIRYLVVMPLVFASLHLAYGLGSCWGVAKALKHTVSRLGAKPGELSRPC